MQGWSEGLCLLYKNTALVGASVICKEFKHLYKYSIRFSMNDVEALSVALQSENNL